jgi:hypothetical protein
MTQLTGIIPSLWCFIIQLDRGVPALAIGAIRPKCMPPYEQGAKILRRTYEVAAKPCRQHYDGLSLGVAAHAQQYNQTNLVSSTSGIAPVTDASLVDPLGTQSRIKQCLVDVGQ